MKSLTPEKQKELFRKLHVIRHKAKTTNYSCVYGIQPPALARALGSTIPEAETLIATYWERNWAVLKVSEALTVKTIDGQKWLFNPVSKFWYSLRNEKDRFSTLNQGTATYVFDLWVKEVRARRPQLTAQFHDEICLCLREGNRDKGTTLVQEAIERVNDTLQLNKLMAVDNKFGKTYSDVH